MRFTGRKANSITRCAKALRPNSCSSIVGKQWLYTSTSASESFDLHPSEAPSTTSTSDARFDILGGSSPLLSVSLSASQHLYTRSGTLVGLAGKAENTVSTLSLLEPFSRTVLRIPFLYKMITSTTPVTALISTKAPNTTISAVHLDGTTDWMLAGQSLLAWTGRTLIVRPTANLKMSMAHWGSSEVTGRGLLALVGQGNISEINLNAGESYIIHPSNVIAYTIQSQRPIPYRLKSSSFRLQVPRISKGLLSNTRFFKIFRESAIWQTISKVIFQARTWVRRIIWADRLFLQFHGPTTILLQTRTRNRREILTTSEVNEMADMQPSAIPDILKLGKQENNNASINNLKTGIKPPIPKSPTMQRASVGKDGRVSFEPIEDVVASR